MQIWSLVVWLLVVTKDDLVIFKADCFAEPTVLFYIPFISNHTKLNEDVEHLIPRLPR